MYMITGPLSLVMDHKTLIEDVRHQAAAPIIVCIDTLNRSFKGSESKDEDMTAYIQAADAIVGAFDCLVIIIHHGPHDGSRPRGHSSLIGAVDVQIAVQKQGWNVTAELELAKDLEQGLTFVSKLEKVELGIDQDGDVITSLIVRELEDAPAPKTAQKGRGDNITSIKREIADAYYRLADGATQTYGLNNNLVRKVPIDKIRDEVRARGYLDANGKGQITATSRSQFLRAKIDLFASKDWVEADGQFWRLSP
jgi:hypothetical protein